MKKVIILCDRCGAEIRNAPKRFSVQEVRDAAGDSETIVPAESKTDDMDFCESCFQAVTDFMIHWKTPEKDPVSPAKMTKDTAASETGSGPSKNALAGVGEIPETKTSPGPVKKDGPAQIYHDEIELYLDQRKSTKWIAEKLNKYGVGYSIAFDAVEAVKKEREEKLVRKIVKR